MIKREFHHLSEMKQNIVIFRQTATRNRIKSMPNEADIVHFRGQALTQRYYKKQAEMQSQVQEMEPSCALNRNIDPNFGAFQKSPKFIIKRKYLTFASEKVGPKAGNARQLLASSQLSSLEEGNLQSRFKSSSLMPTIAGQIKSKYKYFTMSKNIKKKLLANPELQIQTKKWQKSPYSSIANMETRVNVNRERYNKSIKFFSLKKDKIGQHTEKVFRPWSGADSENNF